MPHHRTLQQIEKYDAWTPTEARDSVVEKAIIARLQADIKLLIEALRFAVVCSSMENEDPQRVDYSCNLCLKAAQTHQKK